MINWLDKMYMFGPKRVQIEVTNRCNLNCTMCPRSFLNLPQEDMKYNIFLQILSKLKDVKKIWLTGWGEPFLHPNIIEMAKDIIKSGIKAGVTTNGILPENIRLEDLLIFDEIMFSIESINAGCQYGHKDTRSINTIIKVLKLRNGIKKPIIGIQSVFGGNNQNHILELIRWSKGIGADFLKIIPINIFHQDRLKQPDADVTKDFFKKALKLGSNIKFRVDIPNIAMGDGILRVVYKIGIKFLIFFNLHCLKPLNYLYVTLDGKISPCCELPRYIVGDLMKNDIKSIWTGAVLNNFRIHQKEICKKCSLALN